MKRFLYVVLLSIPLFTHAQVYLDPEPIKAYDFEEYIKNDSFYDYNPRTVHYVEYNTGSISLKYIFDLFANITHINPNTSNVTLHIYKPGKKAAKPYSYVDVFLDNTGYIIPETWYKYYENCFSEFFKGLQMQSISSKVSDKKHIRFFDNDNMVFFNIYMYSEGTKNYIEILVNERDAVIENQITQENLSKTNNLSAITTDN